MAAAPSFTSTPRLEVQPVSTANTARDGTGTIVDVLTAAAAGTKINRIVVQATGDPADSVVTIFIRDAAGTYRLFDEFDLANPAPASTTLPGFRAERSYTDLVLTGAGTAQRLSAAITVALTAGVVNVFVAGGDLT